MSTRATLDEIRGHLQAAEALWNKLPRDEQDALTERQNVNEDTSLRHCLRWGAQHAEEMVELSESMEARPS